MAETKTPTPPPAEFKQIQVLMGPYRDHRLTVTAADYDAAIAAKWAIDPFPDPAALAKMQDPKPDEPPPEPMSDADRKAAWDASHAWAQAQWDLAQGTGNPKHQEGHDTRPAEAHGEAHGGAPHEGRTKR